MKEAERTFTINLTEKELEYLAYVVGRDVAVLKNDYLKYGLNFAALRVGRIAQEKIERKLIG